MVHPLLYEINTRCWLHELSDRVGRPISLDEVPESEFAEWAAAGFTHIWLMGVWSCGPLAREKALQGSEQRAAYSRALPDWVDADVAGSPYAIAEYRVPANLGGNAGLRAFRTKLNARGMRLVLDFVPNHFGLDTPLATAHPEVFVQAKPDDHRAFLKMTAKGPKWLAHGKDPNFAAWQDTIQLDYRKTSTRVVMLETLQEISSHCDGVRCDMAMLLLNRVFSKTWEDFPIIEPLPNKEFWEGAIAAVKRAAPDFVFLAEVYWGLEPELKGLGFDYTYDKTLYDLLISRQAQGIQTHVMRLGAEALASGAHFLENHDEPRIAALTNWSEQRAAALIILGIPGMRFLHDGQLTGARLRIPVQLARRSREPIDSEIQNGYAKLLRALRLSLVGKGRPTVLLPRAAWPENPSAQNFVLIQWQSAGSRFDLVAVNLAANRGQCFVPVELPDSLPVSWAVEDLLSEERYVRTAEDLGNRGFYLDVAPFSAQLLTFRPS